MASEQDRTISALDRRLMALELRKGGASYRQIAKQLGYGGPGAAYKAIDTALRETQREPAEKVRTMELARIDAALMAIWPKVTAGDLAAINTFIRLQERRAKLLGLDAPSRTWLSGVDDTPLIDMEEIAERVDATIDQLIERRRAGGPEAPADAGAEGGPAVSVEKLGAP